MFSTLRTRFGIPGVISVIALVFAMLGGAYAANNASSGGKATASAKAKRGPRGPKGATGPAGPQGPVGPQGAKGDAGANGSNGAPGKDGTSVAGAPIAAGGACGTGVTGVKYTLGETSTNVCNGKNGTNGTNGEDGMCTAGNPSCALPSGAELVGAWGTSGSPTVSLVEGHLSEKFSLSLPAISFNVRVSPPPVALWEFEAGGPGGPVGGVELEDGTTSLYEFTGSFEAWNEAWTSACPGSADQPEAAPGFLCIYNKEIKDISRPVAVPQFAEAANEYGIDVPWGVEKEGFAKGSWAVKAQ